MSNPVLQALKTARQVATTAAIVLGAFGLPALMAGGVMLPDLVPTESVEWMGTGDDDPVVYIGIEQEGPTGKADEDQAATDPAPAGSEQDSTEAPSQQPDALQVASRRPTPETSKAASSSSSIVDAARSTPIDGAQGPRAATGFQARIEAQREARAKARAKSAGKKCQDPVAGIDHLYGDRYVVQRAVIEKYTTVEEAMKLARVGWHKDANGRTDGFKLYRIACGSPLAQVGLRSGDVVHTINGRQVRTLPQAFVAVRKVKRHDAIRVEMSRGGERMTRMVTVE